MAYPDLAADLSKQWLSVGEVDISDCAVSRKGLLTSYLELPELNDKVILNFTQRYRNPHINYFFLKKYQDKLLFAGTKEEWLNFCEKWELDIPLLMVKDFLQLCYIMKKAKFTMGNQSFQWNCAEAMKIPRLLEYCEGAPNCQSFIGENSYGYYHQAGAQYYFKELMKIKK